MANLSQDGKNWLTNALDPFHDTPVTVNGMPDGDMGDTVVQTIKKKISLTAPPSAGTGRWDCHIYSTPYMSTPNATTTAPYGAASATVVQVTGKGRLNESVILDNNQPYPIGTVVAICVPAGQLTYPRFDSSNPTDNGLPATGTSLPVWHEIDAVDGPSDPGGMSKLISGGFEVHNDTAELYLGGNVTVYHAPQSMIVGFSELLDSANTVELMQTRGPPSDVADATFYPNSRSWGAKEGCVVPFYLSDLDRGFRPACLSAPFSRTLDTSYTEGAAVVIDHGVLGNTYRSNSLATSSCRLAGMQTVGAYFTGLTAESVLTLDVRFTVERRPAAANATLLSLSSPTAAYDRAALQMYSQVRAKLPVGAPVCWNDTGKWWQTVLGFMKPALRQAAPSLVKIIAQEGNGKKKIVQTSGTTQGPKPSPTTPKRKKEKK